MVGHNCLPLKLFVDIITIREAKKHCLYSFRTLKQFGDAFGDYAIDATCGSRCLRIALTVRDGHEDEVLTPHGGGGADEGAAGPPLHLEVGLRHILLLCVDIWRGL